MELHRLFPLLHDDLPDPVWGVDRATVGLHAHSKKSGEFDHHDDDNVEDDDYDDGIGDYGDYDDDGDDE